MDAEVVPRSAKLEALDDLADSNLDLCRRYARDVSFLTEGNILYQRCFQILKLGGLEAEIPRLVVFGQQSMGKTTLLDMIMGGPIGYSSTDTGTKQPVVIMLKPSRSTTGSFEASIECVLNGKSVKIRDLHSEMKKIMSNIDTISSEELELEISVPNGVHAVFVDLPGIKDDSKDGSELTRNVVRTYVRNNPNDLYILVKKASDDPANWPWTLREFILSPRPTGLGLTPRQTMVVGTRSKDFLIGEKNDIKTQAELVDRVSKRAIRDHNGTVLPLYLLELFSLTIEEKEVLGFQSRRTVMENQIIEGKRACQCLINDSFQFSTKEAQDKLLGCFDYEVFRSDLNQNFQRLLVDQLGILERKLHKRKLEMIKSIKKYEEINTNESLTQSIRESVKLFVRELIQMVSELITGNFMIMRLEGNGDSFLHKYGGSVRDNLAEGHNLAKELFNKQQYDENFLSNTEVQSEKILKRIDARKESERRIENSKDQMPEIKALPDFRELPAPDKSGKFLPGQFVRFTVHKDSSRILGFLKKVDKLNCLVSFNYKAHVESHQERSVERHKIEVVVPLSFAINSTSVSSNTRFLAWRKTYRSDDWVGLEPVMVNSISDLKPVANPWITDASDEVAKNSISGTTTVFDGRAQVTKCEIKPDLNLILRISDIKDPTGGKHDGIAEDSVEIDKSGFVESLSLFDLFLDADVYNDGQWKSLTALQRISGTSAEAKLLSHVSLTYLNVWLKFHVSNLEPECRYPEHVLLQMMRSAQRVVDQADWKPLVADLLQSNVKGGLLQLAKLASCASAVALKRVLKASLIETKAHILGGDLNSSLMFLVSSPRFIEEVETAMDDFCKDRAKKCADDIRQLIVDQTQAINFDVVLDVFEGCRQFEAEFLGSTSLCNLADTVKQKLELRRQRLGNADIFAKGHAGNLPLDMIYEEVRVHFWVVKLLLASPMTTKLYTAFIKDIKDKTLVLLPAD